MTVRVLVVDDSQFFRDVVIDILRRHADLEVVGEAGDGVKAIGEVVRLRPDVVTMDVLLPLLGGIEAIRAIMAKRPTPIVVLSRLVGSGQNLGLAAIAAGAIDLLEKPLGGVDASWERRLLELLRDAAHGHVAPPAAPRPRPAPRLRIRRPPRLIGLVASTGGPQVLRGVLGALPRGFPIPIVVVQHTVPGLTAPLARWLDDATALAVAVAVAGRPVTAGQVALAPDGMHLEIDRGGVARISGGPPEAGHRPSGSVLLRSLARSFSSEAMGVVLTGMGRDGAEGLAEIARAGGVTAVQDPEDAVIDTMPRHALAAVRAATVTTAADLPTLLQGASRGGAGD